MYLEKRKIGKDIKYYLVHSYRDKKEVRKIRRYLGLNISSGELEKREKEAEKFILEIIEEFNTEVFNFVLTKKQIEKLNNYNKKIKIHHLENFNWKQFTENFVYNTNAIEGSSLEFDEVKEILEEKKPGINSDEIEAKGVAKAVKFIRKTKEELSLDLIRKIHKLCFEDSKSFAGQFRNVGVVIKNSNGEIIHVGESVSKLKESMDELILWYQKNKNLFKPLILATIIHNQFEHIHPFQDGNGRVGRLLLNFILIKNKYPPINVRLEDRRGYYLSLQDYSKNNDLRPTLKFLISQYNKMLSKNKRLRKVTTKKKK